MYSKHDVHKTVFFMYLTDTQRDLICFAWTVVTVFTSLTSIKQHVLCDGPIKLCVCVEIAQEINAEVAELKCWLFSAGLRKCEKEFITENHDWEQVIVSSPTIPLPQITVQWSQATQTTLLMTVYQTT